VNPDEGGVRLFCGKITHVLSPGLHWVCPLIGDVVKMQTCEATADLRNQALMTSDGYKIGVSFVVNSKVVDVKTAGWAVANHYDLLECHAKSIIADAVNDRSWDDIQDHSEIEEEVEQSLRSRMRGYGIEVLSVGLDSLTDQRVFRLIQDQGAYGLDE
jgi:regulator of protease activity HflC (stomatin/prohibitin superfamily)